MTWGGGVSGGGGGDKSYPDYLCRQDIPDGTAGDPFTDIRQIYGLGLDGQYFFNDGSTTFDLYVKDNSALVARYDDAAYNGGATGLTQTLSLTNTEVGGVFDSSVSAFFANANGVALRMFNGNGTHVDATSDDARYIQQIAAFNSLYPGTATSPTTGYVLADYVAMSASWVGTGSAELSSTAGLTAPTALNLNIFHSSGDGGKVVIRPDGVDICAINANATTNESTAELYVTVSGPTADPKFYYSHQGDGVYNTTTGPLSPITITDWQADGYTVCTAEEFSQGGGEEHSTGVRDGLRLTAGTTSTTISVSDGFGYAIDAYSDPENPATIRLDGTGLTDIEIENIGTQDATYVSLNSAGSLVQQGTRWTDAQHRNELVLGVVFHRDRVSIDAIEIETQYGVDPVSQLYDILEGIGLVNVDGNVISPNGANMSVDKSFGKLMGPGINYGNDVLDPHHLDMPALTVAQIEYKLRDGTTVGSLTNTVIDPDNYDLAGVLTAVPPNRYTVQRVSLFPSNNLEVQYGQEFYQTKEEAAAAINSQDFVTEQIIGEDALLRSFIVVKSGTTSLSNTDDVSFVPPNKFGEIASGGSGGTGSPVAASRINSASGPLATAITDTKCDIGEFSFRYSANAVGGNLEVFSDTAKTIHVQRFEINISSEGNYSTPVVAVPASTWTLIPAGNINADGTLEYKLLDENGDWYKVTIWNTSSVITVTAEYFQQAASETAFVVNAYPRTAGVFNTLTDLNAAHTSDNTVDSSTATVRNYDGSMTHVDGITTVPGVGVQSYSMLLVGGVWLVSGWTLYSTAGSDPIEYVGTGQRLAATSYPNNHTWYRLLNLTVQTGTSQSIQTSSDGGTTWTTVATTPGSTVRESVTAIVAPDDLYQITGTPTILNWVETDLEVPEAPVTTTYTRGDASVTPLALNTPDGRIEVSYDPNTGADIFFKALVADDILNVSLSGPFGTTGTRSYAGGEIDFAINTLTATALNPGVLAFNPGDVTTVDFIDSSFRWYRAHIAFQFGAVTPTTSMQIRQIN